MHLVDCLGESRVKENFKHGSERGHWKRSLWQPRQCPTLPPRLGGESGTGQSDEGIVALRNTGAAGGGASSHRMDRPSREEIIGLCATAPEQVADLTVALDRQVQTL